MSATSVETFAYRKRLVSGPIPSPSVPTMSASITEVFSTTSADQPSVVPPPPVPHASGGAFAAQMARAMLRVHEGQNLAVDPASLRATDISPGLQVLTPASMKSDREALAAFALSQGIDAEAVKWLLQEHGAEDRQSERDDADAVGQALAAGDEALLTVAPLAGGAAIPVSTLSMERLVVADTEQADRGGDLMPTGQAAFRVSGARSAELQPSAEVGLPSTSTEAALGEPRGAADRVVAVPMAGERQWSGAVSGAKTVTEPTAPSEPLDAGHRFLPGAALGGAQPSGAESSQEGQSLTASAGPKTPLQAPLLPAILAWAQERGMTERVSPADADAPTESEALVVPGLPVDKKPRSAAAGAADRVPVPTPMSARNTHAEVLELDADLVVDLNDWIDREWAEPVVVKSDALNTPSAGTSGGSPSSPIAPKPETPATAGAPPATGDRAEELQALAQRVGQAVGQRLLSMIERGHWHVRFMLKPQQLGDIEVDLRMRGGELEAAFRATQVFTRDLLQDGLPRLREVMSSMGMDVANMQVGNGLAQRHGGNPTFRSPSQTAGGARQEAQTDVVQASPSSSKRAGGGWDVMV